MRQRLLPKAGFSVSELGLGCEHLQGKDEGLIREVVGAALDGGINILDLFMSEPNVRANIGRALGNRRDRVAVQGPHRLGLAGRPVHQNPRPGAVPALF